MTWDLLLYNLKIANPSSRNTLQLDEHMAIAINAETIAAVISVNELPDAPDNCAKQTLNLGGKWVLPGLIDCHTHLVFGGNRSNEFEQRLQGKSYTEISQQGGGIKATVKATRDASTEQLMNSAQHRLEDMLNHGVTHVEIKSGYGLDYENEVRSLQIARKLGERLPVSVSTSFLGAHALPTEFEDSQSYIDYLCNTLLPDIVQKGLADAVDGFCENIAFSASQIEQLFAAASKLNMPVKLHSDQLSSHGGTEVAARFKALSVDHLEYTTSEDLQKIKQSNTIPVLLPGAFYYLQETKKPDIESMRQLELPMAVASDCNPGSSPISNPLIILNMACICFGLTPEEAICGMTLNAAKALGLADKTGSIEPGKRADLSIWNVKRPADLCYWIGLNNCSAVVQAGHYRHINK